MKKRIVSLALALALLIGCLPMGAGAYSTDPAVNCTYVAWKMATDRGFYVPEDWGNGGEWFEHAKNAGYHVEGPDYGVMANSIACWGGGLYGYGHVAYVLDANDTTVTICEGGTGGAPRTWSPSWNTMKNGRYAVDGNGTRYPMYLQGYIVLDKTPAPSAITLDNPWADNVSNTGATLHSVIRNNRQRVRAYGMVVWEKSTKKNVIDHWEDIPSNYQTLNHIDIWVDTISELGVSLKPGTEYSYFFYIDEGGKIFSSEATFKTNGTGGPTVSRLAIDKKELFAGESITFTCTSDTATGYTLGVNKGSTRVLTQEVPGGSFTATFEEPGEYSAYVSAYNDGGMLDSTRVYFTVKPADGGDVPFDPTPENDFVDVPNGAYFAKAVNWAVDNGITEGTSRTTFSPNRVCTRAQAVTFLWRSMGSPKPGLNSTKFTDVPAGEYYTDAVLWAVENGITGGVSETSFAPNSKCTRAQIVSFMYRMKGAPAVGGVSPFLDVPPTLYYAGAVAWAVENGITEGTSANYFSPHNDCSRGQIVTFLYRGK